MSEQQGEITKEAFDFDLHIDESDVAKMTKVGLAALIARKALMNQDARSLPKKTLLPPEAILANKQSEMMEHITVRFEKDRVQFIYHKFPKKHVVAEILVSEMQPSMTAFFKSKDKEFFKNYFKIAGNRESITKTATGEKMEKLAVTKNNASTLFLKSDISPIAYFKAMFGKYKSTFLQMDTEILVKKIELDFSLDPFPINTNALGKIFFIQNINANSKTFESPFAFEKLIRSFNDQPFDFFVKQADSITPTEIAYTLHCANEVTPNVEIYKLFTKDVVVFLAERLYEKGCHMFWPLEVSSGAGQLDFYRSINTEIARLSITGETGEGDKLKFSENLKHILTQAKDLYSAYRKGDLDIDSLKTNIAALKAKDLYVGNQVMAQVFLNVGMDAYIQDAKKKIAEQLAAYSLK